MDINSISDLRRAYRNGPYAWPGGYPCYFVTSDGCALSFKAVKENLRAVIYATANRTNDGWQVAGLDINWEDPELYCDHTGERIESACAE